MEIVTQSTHDCVGGYLGGYDHKFVGSPHDRFVCKICDLPCRDPHLTVCCGHNLCKSCLDNVKKATEVCPVCRDGQFFTVPNKQADREIRSLYVMCTNNERGCEWQGEVNDTNNHLLNDNGCRYMVVNCPNDCGESHCNDSPIMLKQIVHIKRLNVTIATLEANITLLRMNKRSSAPSFPCLVPMAVR